MKFTRLFFRPPIAADGRIEDVSGMSGGPVFGYRQTAEGLRYWLVGVQSKQLDQSRLAIACPAEPFARAFEEAMADVIAERRLEQQ